MVKPSPSLRGPYDRQAVDAYLTDATVPLRLAASMANGFPVLVSLWYHWDGEHLWCAMHESARLVRHLRREPRVAFEVAPDTPPYRGVRGQGIAEFDTSTDGHALLRQLLGRYLGTTDSDLGRWLLSRPGELALRIRPTALSSWDYGSRM